MPLLKTLSPKKLFAATLFTSAFLLHGCSSIPEPEENLCQGNKCQFGLLYNLNNPDLKKTYPLFYLNDTMILNGRLTLKPGSYQLRIKFYPNKAGSVEQNFDLQIDAKKCYYLNYQDSRYQVVADKLTGKACIEQIVHNRSRILTR